MIKEVLLNKESLDKLVNGVNILATAVGVTLGPKGRNVVIEIAPDVPHVTKDGVTVAKHIFLKDPTENLAAQMVKEAASRTADVAGDGTTTSTVLAHFIVNEGVKSIQEGYNPIGLKRGIDKAVTEVVKYLQSKAEVIDTDSNKLKQIAIVSSNGDTEIGEFVYNIFHKIGKNGIVKVLQGDITETRVDIVEGMQFDRGYISANFVTDNIKMECELNNPLILLYGGKISYMKDIIQLLERVAQDQRELLIIADDVDGEALSALVVNKLRGSLKVAAIKAPGFGDRKLEMLEDIAAVTGGVVISAEKDMKIDDIRMEYLGQATSVLIEKDKTVIVEGKGNAENIQLRVNQLKEQVKTAKGYDKEIIEERLAKLGSGMAIITVGGYSELEVREKRDRIDDAICAAKAALEQGILPGGGSTYVKAAEAVMVPVNNKDEKAGVDILLSALSYPLIQMLENGGIDPNPILKKVKGGDDNYSYNVDTGEYGDMKEMGIVDPLKVSISALQNAASVASLILTTGCAITNIQNNQKNQILC